MCWALPHRLRFNATALSARQSLSARAAARRKINAVDVGERRRSISAAQRRVGLTLRARERNPGPTARHKTIRGEGSNWTRCSSVFRLGISLVRNKVSLAARTLPRPAQAIPPLPLPGAGKQRRRAPRARIAHAALLAGRARRALTLLAFARWRCTEVTSGHTRPGGLAEFSEAVRHLRRNATTRGPADVAGTCSAP